MKILQRFLFIFFCFIIATSWAQEVPNEVPYYTNSGLVNYYFWEEDSAGGIIESTFSTPFSANTLITLKHPLAAKGIEQNTFQRVIMRIAKPHITEQKSTEFKLKVNRRKALLNGIGCVQPKAVIFRCKDGFWTSEAVGRILYFSKIGSESRTFTHATSDELRILNPDTKQIQTTTIPYQSYQVISFFSSRSDAQNNVVAYNQVKGFRGHDFTESLVHPVKFSPKHFVIFINGYRGPAFDDNPSKNEVYLNDRTNYWFNIDNRFMQRLQPDTSFYLDASFTVKTSNHHTKLGFGMSYLKCTGFATEKRNRRKYNWLNSKPNVCGFDWRKRNGYIAGLAFLNTINNQPTHTAKDTIDIVCHSMGYAYSLGFLQAIEGKLVLRKCFIIAPENANAGNYDWTKFQEVWQYGSNLGEEQQDILVHQDGVAPQVAITGLKVNSAPYGRIFSPKNWPNKHFIHSHMIYSYDWMFDRIYQGQPGYID